MDALKILFGTESGNAELVADDIAETFTAAGVKAEAADMETFDVADLADAGVVVVVTSTYGEGELPATTAPFHDALLAAGPDLSGLRFAAFGLGDSTYETYNNAVSILISTLLRLGARQIGEIGRHDAVGGETFTDAATSWAETVVEAL